MSRKRGSSAEVRKSESPEVSQKSEVRSPESEEKNNSAFDIPNSEINNQSEIENPISEIKTMEVHHHPEVEKKGLKEYFLEGLMIFLAVTMGFFAESIREHIADGAKETEYMHSMIQDLQADTTELNSSKMAFNRTCQVTDTILTCLKADNPDPFVINHAISNHFWSYAEYSYNNRTVQQLSLIHI